MEAIISAYTKLFLLLILISLSVFILPKGGGFFKVQTYFNSFVKILNTPSPHPHPK